MLSALAAFEQFSARLAQFDDPAVVVSVIDPALVRRWASVVDASPPAAVPLRGTTFTVKDNIDVEGAVTTAGCPTFGRSAPRSATVVERLLAAGALPVAKVNLDQFATGLVGMRSPYGTPRNPFDDRLVPGGSSSGSAVSVARGLVPFSLGTDTAGSGRVPAAMCGIVGLKPTRGWLSTAGVVPAVQSLDCVSVFATDLVLASDVARIAGGFDPLDPMSRPVPPSDRAALRTVGVVDDATLVDLGVADHIAAAYRAAIAVFAESGVSVVEVDLAPLLEIGTLLYGGPWVAERVAAVGDFLAGDHDGVDPVVRSIIDGARRWTAVDAHRAGYRLARLRHVVDEMFERIDGLLTPTIACEATLVEVQAEPLAANERLGWFTTFSNLADMCALSFPVAAVEPAASERRPPPSLSLHGPAWSDDMLTRGAMLLTDPPLSGPLESDRDHQVPHGWTRLVVAGAHLRGLPLEHQLTDRGALWMGTTRTSSCYRLYALSGTVPPKPGLVRVPTGEGAKIEVDVWALAPAAFGDFVAAVPAPLCIGTVELTDGSSAPGFLCEPVGLDGSVDITSTGGWRSYVATR